MVVRTRISAILTPLLAYCLAGAAVSYFVWQARYGSRGLETKAEYKTQIARLSVELQDLETERQHWEHRIKLIRSESVDRDLLEEEAHAVLGRYDRRDVVVFTGSPVAEE